MLKLLAWGLLTKRTYVRLKTESLSIQYPEVHSRGVNFKFPGRGQRDTPVTTARGIVEIIMLLPGRQAARVRRQAQVSCWGTPPKLQTKTLAFYVETFGLGAADKAHICALENRNP